MPEAEEALKKENLLPVILSRMSFIIMMNPKQAIQSWVCHKVIFFVEKRARVFTEQEYANKAKVSSAKGELGVFFW